ncbi:MAG: penicillin acylase family protein, partial [Caldilineae bacterium]
MTIPLILTILVVLFVLVALFGLLFTYVYWWLIQRALPQHEGEVALDCLDAPVTILRDRHGVPHIYAENQADLLRAQGFVHAQDRLWQMEQNRRIAHGTLAELFGRAALDVDRFSRIV